MSIFTPLRRTLLTALLATGLFLPFGASAITLDATLVNLGGNDYRFDYILSNDGSLGPDFSIESFDIEFIDSEILGWREIGGSVDDWWEDSSSVLGTSYFYADFFTGSGGIGSGESATFSVSFNWRGTVGVPGTQWLTIYDPTNYDNFWSFESTPAIVPIPSTGILMLFGLALLGATQVLITARTAQTTTISLACSLRARFASFSSKVAKRIA